METEAESEGNHFNVCKVSKGSKVYETCRNLFRVVERDAPKRIAASSQPCEAATPQTLLRLLMDVAQISLLSAFEMTLYVVRAQQDIQGLNGKLPKSNPSRYLRHLGLREARRRVPSRLCLLILLYNLLHRTRSYHAFHWATDNEMRNSPDVRM